MKVKVSEASGPVLDWLVCEATGLLNAYPTTRKWFMKQWSGNSSKFLHPSSDWAQGGPIIEREGICFASIRKGRKIAGWRAAYRKDGVFGFDSSTTLIAACRCFVASKLGEEVEVPDELA